MTSVSAVFDGKPFIFFSYAHKNDHAAAQILTMLQEEGFRVWYDEGLTPGDDQYNSVIEARARDCAVIIPVISREYCQSKYCPKEFVFARECYNKPVLAIYLEDPEELKNYYTNGIGLWLSGETGIILNKETSLSDFRKQIHKIKILHPCNRAYDNILPQKQQDTAKPSAVLTFEEYSSNIDKRTDSKRKNSSAINHLLEIVIKDIEDKRFPDAQKGLDSILQDDPTNPDAHYYQLLVKYGVSSTEDLARLQIPLDPADIRAASLFQSPERRQALADALTENRNYQQYFLASTHMKAGRYQTAITIFSTIQDYRDSGEKIAECRELIAQEELSAAYKREVKDGRLYLSEQLRLKEPDKYSRYSELCSSTAFKPTNYISSVLFAGMFAAAGAGLFAMPDSRVLFWFSAALSVFFGLFCCFLHPIAGIGVIVVCLLLLFKFKSALAVIMIILAAVAFMVGYSYYRSGRRYKKDLVEKDSFYRQYIKDFEETEREAINAKYAAIPEAERKPLLSVEEALRVKRRR